MARARKESVPHIVFFSVSVSIKPTDTTRIPFRGKPRFEPMTSLHFLVLSASA